MVLNMKSASDVYSIYSSRYYSNGGLDTCTLYSLLLITFIFWLIHIKVHNISVWLMRVNIYFIQVHMIVCPYECDKWSYDIEVDY